MTTKMPDKQRKRQILAPHHVKQKFMSAPLSSELQDKYGVKNMPVRSKDKVKILRGDFKNHTGEVVSVNLKTGRIFVDGATLEKTDGTETYYPIHPSNIEITDMDTKDERRMKIIERRG